MTRGGEQVEPAAPEPRVPPQAGTAGAAGVEAGGPARRVGGCVVLTEPKATPPEELLAGLARRGMPATVVTDVPAVMVRLARGGAAALLVGAGVRSTAMADLLDAVRRYHPSTGCWTFARTDRGIRVTRMAEPTGETSAASRGATLPVNGQAKRRSLDDIVLHLPGAELSPGEPLVTEEELAMLLGSGSGQVRE